MREEQIKELLKKVKAGDIDVDGAVDQLRHLPYEDIGCARIDHHRQLRRGFPETILCQGKTPEQVVKIFTGLAQKGGNVLATRAHEAVTSALKEANISPEVRYNTLGRVVTLEQAPLPRSQAILPIITAGTADLPVAEEARATAEIMGQRSKLICDVGVSGLHRVLAHLDSFRAANCVIVVAGMEGALASVVGGLVNCPVIAVPTSVGYGSSLGGLSALLTMLNSCASGITVVNIDNGFSAAITATLINRKIEGKP